MQSLIILKKPFHQRNSAEIRHLFNSLRFLPFFSKILSEQGFDCVMECLKHLSLESFPAQSIVFEKGTFGSKFYVILKGFVSISLKTANFITEIPEFDYLKEGDSFGELALLTGKPRTATLKCETDCLFGVLEKRHFLLILNAIQMKEINEKIDFLKEVPLFMKIPLIKFNNMVYTLKKRTYFKGNYLYKEKETSNDIFITKTGEFLLESISKKMQIGVLGVKEVLGFEEILKNQPRKYSIRCLSAICEIYVIKKKEFFKIFSSGEECLQYMSNFSNMRDKFREDLVKRSNICREEMKKEFIERIIKKKPAICLNQTIGFSEDFSIKSPFQKDKSRRNRSFEQSPKKESERISIRKGTPHKKQDVSEQIDIIVTAKEKILNKISQNKECDFASFCQGNILIATETAKGLQKQMKKRVEILLKKRDSLNNSNFF